VGVVNALGHGAGSVIFGKLSTCTPTVFKCQWLNYIKASIKTYDNPNGTVSNSDLEMAGLVSLWLAMEGVCGGLQEKHVTLFSKNNPNGLIGDMPCLQEISHGGTPNTSLGIASQNPTSFCPHPHAH
jgi:hypothetical protein